VELRGIMAVMVDTIIGKGLMEEVTAEALIAGLIVCVDCDLN
jgi:hypothetical protein